MKSCRSGLILVVIVALWGSLVSAQTYQGRILGSVTDSSGAIVGGAKVTITNGATGISRTLTTNGAGDYNAPNLEPGPYMAPVSSERSVPACSSRWRKTFASISDWIQAQLMKP